ncbi:MAG: hypothetical protein RIM72_18525 [Alphaproteobacteria bacterium]
MLHSKDRKGVDVTASPQPDYEEIVRDPSAWFDRPDQVVAASGLTEAQKIEVLRAWELDARQLMNATEENMPGGEESKLDSVLDSLKRLGLGPSEPAGPSKVGL